MRTTRFANKEFYHIFNRGVDKRSIFSRPADVDRFLQCMVEFNTRDPIGSLYQLSFQKQKKMTSKKDSLVNVICYCLNQNHFHMILEQVSEKGIEKFMHRLGTGYTHYFNKANRRTGSLFQGSYKAIHIDSNEYLLYLSAYVSLNYRVHQLSSLAAKLVRSSWGEYMKKSHGAQSICVKNVIMKQFSDVEEYTSFAENALAGMLDRKALSKEIEQYWLE